MDTHLGGMPPESLARLLMWELNAARNANRKEIAPDPGAWIEGFVSQEVGSVTQPIKGPRSI
jgi:hypothetical protein